MSDKKTAYEDRAKRMIERWAGKCSDNNRSHPTKETDFQRSAPHAYIDQDTRKIVEPQRNIPVLDNCDVLVIGGGPAGLSASLSARRAGADTILMEADRLRLTI